MDHHNCLSLSYLWILITLLIELLHLTSQIVCHFFLLCYSFAPQIFAEHFSVPFPETEKDPVRLLGTKDFLCTPQSWLQKIGFIQPPWPSLSSNQQVQTVANQGREEMGRQRRSKQSGNNSAALGQSPGSPSRDTHNILELFCRYWNPHQVGEVNCMLPTSM